MTVFVSYAHQDVDVVAALRQDLEDIGQSVWIDTTLHGGQIWWDEILRQVRDCHVFIFAVSRHSLASEACLSECDYSADVNRPFLPVRIDDVDMTNAPERLRNTQHIDFKVRDAASAKALARSLSNVPNSTPVPDPLPAPPATPQSYRDRYAALLGPEPLSLDDQMNYFVRLTVDIDTANSDEALELLRALHEREDLSWKVRQMIDRFVADRKAAAAESTAPTDSHDGDGPSIEAIDVDHSEPESPPTTPRPRRRLWWALGAAAAAVVIAVVVVLAWPDSKPAKVQQPQNDACDADTCGSTPIRFLLDLAGPPDDIVVTLIDPYGNGVDRVDQPTARQVGDGLQWVWIANYEDPIGTYSVSFANAADTVDQSFTVEPMTDPFGVVQRAAEAISNQDWTAAAALDDRIADEFQQGGAGLLDGEYPAADEKHWYPADASGETNAANTTIIGAYIDYSVSDDTTTANCELWTVDISGNTMRSDALPRDTTQQKSSRTGRLAPSEFSEFIREQCVAAADAT